MKWEGGWRAPPTLTSGLILPSWLNVRQKAAVAFLCTLWQDATPFLVYFDIIMYILVHSFYHIRTVQFIRCHLPRFLSISSSLVSSVGKTSLGVPSRESNSGLPYSKPTHYQLSYATPWRFTGMALTKISLVWNNFIFPGQGEFG
jgi:hypothetical protein